MAPDSEQRTALIVGVGLIGGSVGLCLREAGWHVLGRDRSAVVLERALEVGAIDSIAPVGFLDDVDLTFVATPVGVIANEVEVALRDTTGFVTDVGSVKTPLLQLMENPRFIGGHPMAGSEQEGVDGSRSDLFEGRTWVLTPIETTDDETLATIRSIVSGFGAEVVSLLPALHDSMVAIVSHVPHLTAASLMGLADERSIEHRSLMRLAAGGFRDMTRIAASHPGIWPDICHENREAIVTELDRLVAALSSVRSIVADGDRDALVSILERARSARLALPARFARAEDLAELRIPVADQKGALAGITMIATELDVSIADIEIAHSVEGDEGVVVLLVEAANGALLRDGLTARGYKAVMRSLDGSEDR